jgi:hypothetical protein
MTGIEPQDHPYRAILPKIALRTEDDRKVAPPTTPGILHRLDLDEFLGDIDNLARLTVWFWTKISPRSGNGC